MQFMKERNHINAQFARKDQYVDSVYEEKNLHKCSICEQIFARRDQFKRHVHEGKNTWQKMKLSTYIDNLLMNINAVLADLK